MALSKQTIAIIASRRKTKGKGSFKRPAKHKGRAFA